jgi:hypothetical protein
MWLIIVPHVPLTLNGIVVLTKIFWMLDFPQDELFNLLYPYEHNMPKLDIVCDLLNIGKVMSIC